MDAGVFFVSTISDFTLTKIFIKSFLSTIFSPMSVIFMLFFVFGFTYLLSKRENQIANKQFFSKNKTAITILLLFSLLGNIECSKQSIMKNTADVSENYSKVCRMVPIKMLDEHFTDSEVTDAMAKSGCNPEAFPLIKFLWTIKNTGHSTWKHTHGQYDLREQNDT